MTKPPRQRRFADSRVWALAQEAYLGGESAASVAARLGLTVNGLRKRAARHGWTRTQYEQAARRAADPARALAALVARIGRLVEEGRVDEILPLARTAESLGRVLKTLPEAPPDDHAETEAVIDMLRWRAAEIERMDEKWGERARAMAEALLTERGHPFADRWAASAWRWRAQVLGPEQAALDYAHAVQAGWASRYWDENGRLWPPQPPQCPSTPMAEQHERACAARRERGEGWGVYAWGQELVRRARAGESGVE